MAIIGGGAAIAGERQIAPESIFGPQLVLETPVNPRRLMLPEWVQNTRTVSLWPGAVGKGEPIGTIEPFKVLRVFDAQEGRLQVGFSEQAPSGWIDIPAAQPSDPPATWLQNHHVIRPFLGAHGDATAERAISQFTYLRQAGLPQNGRIPVQIDPRDDKNTIVWVDATVVGPSGAPARVVSTSASTGWASDGEKSLSRSAFIDTVGEAARQSERASGVPAPVTVAQAILESNWGESALARVANNYFGIKASGRIGNGGLVWMRTWEVIGDQDVFVREPFRAYNSLQESIHDHARLFTGLRLYSAAMAVADDPLAFAEAIHRAGYSTDPNYVSKLVQLMDRYNLQSFSAS